MLSFNRHRSLLLLTFCALVLLLQMSASAVCGVKLRLGLPFPGKIMVASDNETVANAAHASSGATAADDSASNGSQCDNGNGVDDQMMLPVLVHVMLHPLRADVPLDTSPFLRPTPSFGPLRPPRAA